MRKSKRYSGLLFFLILVVSYQAFPQNNYNQLPSPVFETLSVEDGLPENSVICILQDHLGYMWFGTQNGLVKYDGYSMTVYKPDTDSDKSISGKEIVTLFEDSKKTLWIGTLKGLNKFNRDDESFKSYQFNQNDINSISSNSVHAIYEDRFGRFWIGTLCGLNLLDRNNERFTRFYFINPNLKAVRDKGQNSNSLGIIAITDDPLSKDILLGTGLKGLWRFNIDTKLFSQFVFSNSTDVNNKISWIQKFYTARDGKIWMASLNSLSSYNPFNKEFKYYFDFPIKDEEKFPEGRYIVSCMIEDQYGKIWAGFYSGDKGLFSVDPVTGEINNFNLFPNRPQNTMLNKIYSLFEDRSGIIWIGTWLSGLIKWKKFENKFSVVQSNKLNSDNLSNPIVYSLICDSKGYTWYCTPNGLDKYDQITQRYTHYLQNEKCVTDFVVYATLIDKSGNLWLGTSNCGLIKFNSQNATYSFYLNNSDKINLIDKTVLCLLQDHLGYIWIGTQGFGIYKYNPINGELNQYKNNPNDSTSLSQDVVLSILEDHNGTLWVGTNLGGLNKFNRENDSFSYAGFQNCLTLFEDSQNRFWVTENPSGLNLFDIDNLKVVDNYSQNDGLASSGIIGISEDKNKNLWLVTDVGISRVIPQNRTVKNFTVENKISDVFNIYFPSCTGKGIDGNMYFNTRKGIVIFNPLDIMDDPVPPQVVISNLSLFNRPNEKLNNPGYISELKEISLPYDQNDLRFDYVGLQFNEPAKNTYEYILENFDDDWVEAGTQRNATYTNLNSGEYVFRVKAANRDGAWSLKDASIKIIILPPWWKTPAAYILYILLAISLIYLTWKLQMKRIRIKQQYEMSRFETEKLHEVDELKTRFFTNISHEFRTPLTLILGPAKRLIERSKDSESKTDADFIHRSAKKLNKLVDELLEISKIESGEMKLKASSLNLVLAVKEIILSFYSLAERKKIQFNLATEENEIVAYVDRGKLDKIISNVVTNAFKFTPEGGKVNVEIVLPTNSGREDNFVEISIRDTGIGIPLDQIDKIFDRFYQVDSGHTRKQEGTGIGLALTKELVELHKGKIEVESEEGKGTTLRIYFRLGKEHLRAEEIYEDEKDYEKEKEIELLELDEALTQTNTSNVGTGSFEKPALLIVEDNLDVRKYVESILESQYKIYEATDGEEGITKALEYIPDLIISDIMMPKMDGYQLCEKIKSEEEISHIPIIMLTAKATLQDKINGLEIGADDYLMKPFEEEELKARIKNLLEQRKRLHEHFRKYGLVELDKKNITSIDQKFLEKAVTVINEHISDTSFSVEVMAKEMTISRSLLLKKLTSLLGETPSDFIRRIRLNKAAALIKNNSDNISQIALEVGFSNPSYFAESFKKQFGLTPSQYQHNSENI